ncbi:glycosyltransferase [Larkinella bovis]|uniref:Glycosyltransferase n=1 Tax=Larkinella bovis TaxID=683041 RepID=A0ABW0II15_9BACT
MRILVVCSGNKPDFDLRLHQAFIFDQVEALKQFDSTLQFDYFFIRGKGIRGYLSCLSELIDRLESRVYNVVHAHVTMPALVANLQRRVPVITTFHGSDINVPWLRVVSLFAELLSHRTIYISPNLAKKAVYTKKNKHAIIPCGVDFDLFKPRPKGESRQQLGLADHKRYVLFSSGFTNPVKNYPLAKAAMDRLPEEVELLELKNYTREQVALLFNAVDVALMTSHSEGSPQFVKEALASNCPVVSTRVGDVESVLGDLAGCYLTSYDAADVAAKLQLVLQNPRPISSRESVRRFDNRLIAQQVWRVYQQVR